MKVFLIVADSFGIGEMPDADKYGDKGSNTLKACFDTGLLSVPTLASLGLFDIDGVNLKKRDNRLIGSFMRLGEASQGKDTTTGHWEMAGVISEKPFPTFPNGFPESVISEFERITGRGTLCNKPYSGTQVIKDYGEEHLRTGKLIVYTSADSVFQIAAHEKIVDTEKLYEYCSAAREMLAGDNAVGRVIARPFTGDNAENFARTAKRRDFSLAPPRKTLLDELSEKGKDVIAVGKIYDIFAGKGITEKIKTVSNDDGMNKTTELLGRDFDGLCFVNLVDFDMLYGHRNDAEGYARALNAFDKRLAEFIGKMQDDDILFVTADHGCDPSTPSTDHSREYVPLLIYGKSLASGVNLGTGDSFADIGKTVGEIFGAGENLSGKSFLSKICAKF
ncbi:MAG TPA: phosphopentomutase [Clostridiales bacterium]|nr:phosphopentomutase [Clostridiales bacterium]